MENDFALGYAMGNDSGGGNGNNGFGISGVGDLVALLVVAGLFGGGGWGFGGFGGGGGGAGLQGMATRADINEGFALQNITSGITGISNGLCDGFHNMTVGMMNGFNGIQGAINGIGHQISDCCCQTGRAIDGVNYNMATQFAALNNNLCGIGRDINDTIRDGFSRMESQNNARYIAELERKLNICDRDSALQGLGTYLINTLRPSPIPAYLSCNPWAGSGGNWNGYNNGANCFGFPA